MSDKPTKIQGTHPAPASGQIERVTAVKLKKPVGRLLVMDGQGAGKSFPLDYTTVTIGRGPLNVIQLDFGDQEIHRHEHAIVIVEIVSEKIALLDSGKSNAVVVNGEPVSDRRVLAFGDLIKIGGTTLRLELY